MRELVLKSGGRLELISSGLDGSTGEERYLHSDVTTDAAAYLMDAVRSEREVYLRDILSLLDLNPTLFQMFFRMREAEHLTKSRGAAAIPEYDVKRIEYLELTPVCKRADGEVTVSHHLAVVGVGRVLREEIECAGSTQHMAGTSIRRSIVGCPMVLLLNLPLRFNGKVTFSEDSSAMGDGCREALTSVVLTPSLAQTVNCVLSELSFDADSLARFSQKAFCQPQATCSGPNKAESEMLGAHISARLASRRKRWLDL